MKALVEEFGSVVLVAVVGAAVLAILNGQNILSGLQTLFAGIAAGVLS